ncbi:MAG: two pore domain potassium channel family protein, partial [Chloroflexi bacterium]|nr:two pore domain potassium channel family protein [Chloroflexota bacterium]
ETTAGKFFTIVYLISGVGLMMAFATAIVQRSRMWVRVEERVAKDNDEGEANETPAIFPSAPGLDASSRRDDEA